MRDILDRGRLFLNETRLTMVDIGTLTTEIINIANVYASKTGSSPLHLHSVAGAKRYVRDALNMNAMVKPGGAILDLGCGFGHMSYLLKRIGFSNVVSADLNHDEPFYIARYNEIFPNDKIPYHSLNILETDDHPLFNTKYDAICISGVLEHVDDFSLFLKRTKYLLKPSGKLCLYRFPNRYSWIERVNDLRFKNAIHHPLRFSSNEVHFMLRWHGYSIDEWAYEEILPVNLRGLPRTSAKTYHAISFLLMPLGRVLCSIPIVNKLSTSFRFISTKAINW